MFLKGSSYQFLIVWFLRQNCHFLVNKDEKSLSKIFKSPKFTETQKLKLKRSNFPPVNIQKFIEISKIHVEKLKSFPFFLQTILSKLFKKSKIHSNFDLLSFRCLLNSCNTLITLFHKSRNRWKSCKVRFFKISLSHFKAHLIKTSPGRIQAATRWVESARYSAHAGTRARPLELSQRHTVQRLRVYFMSFYWFFDGFGHEILLRKSIFDSLKMRWSMRRILMMPFWLILMDFLVGFSWLKIKMKDIINFYGLFLSNVV